MDIDAKVGCEGFLFLHIHYLFSGGSIIGSGDSRGVVTKE